jgi:hypothetical protein
MTFRLEFVQRRLPALIGHIKQQLRVEKLRFSPTLTWESNIHIGKFWHYHIRYERTGSSERMTIRHKHRDGHIIHIENGMVTQNSGIRRFDILFASLSNEMIWKLRNGSVYKLSKKKLEEQYLMKTTYFWSKIEYYLHKKESQAVLFELFGDRKYKIREKRIERSIVHYIENKRNFIEKTRNSALIY